MPSYETPPLLRWPDAIDIVLIGFLIHRLLMLFRGTATLHVTSVLVLLWMLHGLTYEFNLVLTSRFLEALSAVSVLVIVVAFRDEIREVLIQTNPMRLVLGRPTSRTQEEKLGVVAEAMFRLAEQKVGALIVFQNRDRLTELVRNGIGLGGQISVPILETIFAKESAVHDGAVVIRGQRIDRVGAILPLTRRTDLSPQYGTRHRAAIGLSESSDALVLVVSEERGEVSVVHRGQVSVVEDRGALEEILRRHFGWDLRAMRVRSLRRELFRQIAGFVLTTTAVAAYWGVFYGRQVSLTTVTAPIDFQNVPEGLELAWTSDKNLDIQIRGQRPLIEDMKLHPERVGVSVSLKGVRPGRNRTVTIESKDIELPVGLEVFRITPSSLMVDLERHISRVVPVEPRFSGELPEGAVVTVQPDSVVVVGSESSVESLHSVLTEPIAVPGLSAEHPEVVVTAPVSALSGSMRLGEKQPDRVRVVVRVPRAPKPAEEPKQEEVTPAPDPEL